MKIHIEYDNGNIEGLTAIGFAKAVTEYWFCDGNVQGDALISEFKEMVEYLQVYSKFLQRRDWR